MQARVVWAPPSGALGRLVAAAEARAAALSDRVREWRAQARDLPSPPGFGAALQWHPEVGVIAELKRRSPSKGVLDSSLDAGERARAYAEGGARALSVLTEPTEFGGSLNDIQAARRAVALPILRKDFLVATAQVWEARVAGASAVLLIARALGPDAVRRLADSAREAGLESLIEVRDEWELRWALDADAAVIGVNRRNLETLEMEDGVIERLLPAIPGDRVAVAESGIRERGDVARAAALGADAVLVGSSLSTAVDAAAAVRVLGGVFRRSRAA